MLAFSMAVRVIIHPASRLPNQLYGFIVNQPLIFELPKHRERHLLAIQRQHLYLNAGRLNRCLLRRDLALAIAAHLSSSTRANSERTLLGRQFRLVSFYLFTRNLSGLFANAGILLETL